MRQAIHIFKKDVRGIWLAITLTLVIDFLFAAFALRQAMALSERPPFGLDLTGPMLVLAWWILTARVIQSESLAGDQQFWCTRPYNWKSLLGAKTLFLLAFINLPMLLADLLILHAYGFSLLSETPALLWSQFLIIIAIVLPLAALAAVTAGLPQMLSATLSLALVSIISSGGLVGDSPIGPWAALNWIRASLSLVIAAVAALTVVLWQYRARKTLKSRIVAVSAFLAALLVGQFMPWTAALRIQSHLSRHGAEAASVQVSFDTSKKWLARSLPVANDQVQIQIPLRITGVPAGMTYKAEGLTLSIEPPTGARWKSEGDPWLQLNTGADILSSQTNLDGSFYRKIKDEAVKLRGTVYLTMADNLHQANIRFGKRPLPVAGAGVCAVKQEDLDAPPPAGVGGEQPRRYNYMLLCHYAFRSPANIISAFFGHFQPDLFREPISYSPFPADLSFNPVRQYFATRISPVDIPDVVLETSEPAAFIERNFELSSVRLSDFEIKRSKPVY